MGALKVPAAQALVTGGGALALSLAKPTLISNAGAAFVAAAAFVSKGTATLVTAQAKKYECLCAKDFKTGEKAVEDQDEKQDIMGVNPKLANRNLNLAGKALVLTAAVAATVAVLVLGTAFAGAGFASAQALGTATVGVNAARMLMDLASAPKAAPAEPVAPLQEA